MELPMGTAALPLAAASATPLVASAPPLVPGLAAADALGGGSGQKDTPAPPGALPIGWPAAAAVPPPDGPVATLHDRRVRLGPAGAPDEQQPSLYRLCRQWVQNDPDLPAELVEPLPASKLPPLPAQSEEAAAVLQRSPPIEAPLPSPAAVAPAAAGAAAGAPAAAAEAGGTGAGGSAPEPPALDMIMKHHKQHWAAMRQHKKAQAAAAAQRHAQRLQAFMALGGGAAAVAVPMQQ